MHSFQRFPQASSQPRCHCLPVVWQLQLLQPRHHPGSLCEPGSPVPCCRPCTEIVGTTHRLRFCAPLRMHFHRSGCRSQTLTRGSQHTRSPHLVSEGNLKHRPPCPCFLCTGCHKFSASACCRQDKWHLPCAVPTGRSQRFLPSGTSSQQLQAASWSDTRAPNRAAVVQAASTRSDS